MKKILFAIAFVTMMAFGATAQNVDGFFGNWSYDDGDRGETPGIVLPSGVNMSSGVTTDDPSAPLGSGLVILTALGAGYAVARRRK